MNFIVKIFLGQSCVHTRSFLTGPEAQAAYDGMLFVLSLCNRTEYRVEMDAAAPSVPDLRTYRPGPDIDHDTQFFHHGVFREGGE